MSVMKKTDALQYRKAADRVWEIAKQYEDEGDGTLAIAIKELAVQLHDLAREKEMEEQEKGDS